MDPYTTHKIISDATFVAFAAIVAIGYPIARAYAKRIENAPADQRSLPSAEISDARLERVERAVEAMALEVERMSEGQRFMTRLLGESSRTKPPDSRT
ncbi:MAG TPA: hypothetical protein VII66_07855 [Gemmatimonadaceae bacterium]